MMDTKKTFSHPPGASVANPGNTTVNKTGAWRTYRPSLDFNKCTGCGICTRFCPEGCIELGKPEGFQSKSASETKNPNPLKAIIDYDYCKGCRICEVECPFKAISSVVEEK